MKIKCRPPAQQGNLIFFQCGASLNIFEVFYLTKDWSKQLQSGAKTSYSMCMRETDDLFIINIVVLLKLKKFVVQNVRLPRYSGLSSS